MERILEPELMDDPAHAEAYARADFEEPHARLLEFFASAFPGTDVAGPVLDIGCGPGDVTFRIARRFTGARVVALDGSAAMISLANARKEREGEAGTRVAFVTGALPGAAIPEEEYRAVVSTSLLHHLPDPSVLWSTVRAHARPGTLVFVWDLLRPRNREDAARLVERHSGGEPQILQDDFLRSLLASFEPEEVRMQLSACGLPELEVRIADDRHLVAFGVKG